MDDTQVPTEPEWLTIARNELGVHEAPGIDNNARIQQYFASTSLGPHTPDSVPWCAALVGYCLQHANIKPSGSAAARSYLDWGVPLIRPRVGCIVVFSRPPNPASGHVGFWLAENANGTETLAGNSADRVRISYEPTSRVLGWRYPASS